MARRRGNPNWGKPEPIGPVIPVVTSFEQAVKEFKLTPDQYIRSTRLREWHAGTRIQVYSEPLLEAWDLKSNPRCKPIKVPTGASAAFSFCAAR